MVRLQLKFGNSWMDSQIFYDKKAADKQARSWGYLAHERRTVTL